MHLVLGLHSKGKKLGVRRGGGSGGVQEDVVDEGQSSLRVNEMGDDVEVVEGMVSQVVYEGVVEEQSGLRVNEIGDDVEVVVGMLLRVE
ncbi:hypothetical protein L2E82_26171 [Cichorium intybus]|uniref:Uncharacterized protein n=1 Tax=Cichorium intybus TaxID=13427 RepID=A0ACB9E4Y0_CICIN|nr:hypothetical protein L2E82_26171 [Cichorium intybus]